MARSSPTLENLVTRVAARLMPADVASHRDAFDQVLELLCEHFEVDACYLRYNDHDLAATVLVAEWPPRARSVEPDPSGVLRFRDACPGIAESENSKEPRVIRAPGESVAAVPLVWGDVTTGSLRLVASRHRAWTEDEIDSLCLIAALLAQVQARIRAEGDLRYAAYHDSLTGLASRRALLEHLDGRLRRGNAGPVAVLFLDLDRLKALNDFLGHRAADTYLCRIGERLLQVNRPVNLVSRLGGDEFVVVLAGPATLIDAVQRADEIQRVVGESVSLDGQLVGRGVSVGIALGRPGEISSVELIGRADQAMMVVKVQGGNSVGVFTEDMTHEGERRTLIELDLRTSIDDEHLILEYQPEVDLRSGAILGVEALVRWNHPVLGILAPAEFIDVAESTNLAGELGTWVMATACAQLASWKQMIPGLHLTMGINVSPVQLVTVGFDESVASMLRRFGLRGTELCLEITENVVVGDLRRTRATLSRLERLGVRIAIDDFGTGYSSLGHLKSLPVDTLKIDKGFVQNLHRSEGDRVIVNSIAGLAASFGLDLVAEGIESEGAVPYLLELGCRRGQGFLLSKPKPPSEVEELVRRGYVELPWTTGRGRLPGTPRRMP